MGKHFIDTKAFYKFMESWTEFAVGLRNLIEKVNLLLPRAGGGDGSVGE